MTTMGTPGMGMQQDGMQLVSATSAGPAPPNMSAGPAAPDATAMYMGPGNAGYPQGGPAMAAPGMQYGQYGPGPMGEPGCYSGMPQPGMQGPNGCGCGPFPTPEPTTPRWYFRGDAVWLFRDAPNYRNLTSFNNASNTSDPYNNRLILNTDDIAFGLASGMRLTLGHYITDRTAIEGEFYGENNWDVNTGTPAFPSANGIGPLSPYWGNGGGPFSTSAFSNSNQMLVSEQSSFDSGELNIRQWITPSMSVLFGFRYINVGDQFQLTATNNASNVDAGQVGAYRTWTDNNMIGLQFGTEYTHDLFVQWLYFSIEGKGGAFLNFDDQKNLLFNSGTTYDQRSARGTQYSSMLDLSFALTALVGNHLTVRGGYAFLFLDGLALAVDQLDTNPTMANSRNFIADKGSMTLQGPFVGAELSW
jgi:hypothetical protein